MANEEGSYVEIGQCTLRVRQKRSTLEAAVNDGASFMILNGGWARDQQCKHEIYVCNI